MSAVFLDTVGLLALWDVSDQWHSAAEKAFVDLMSQRSTMVTTTFVLLECGNAAARRPYRDQVNKLRLVLEQRNEVVVPTIDDWTAAWQAYDRGEAGSAGIVDHVSILTMRKLGITEVFTNDRHFTAAGFRVLF